MNQLLFIYFIQPFATFNIWEKHLQRKSNEESLQNDLNEFLIRKIQNCDSAYYT